ncbi:MAG TPA: glycosyl hydrolase 115 family protein [Arachnia sp.]|nr:glycosyl hydrolase 115 family protein [Arachnia sp.]HMT87796.1 glycosyl hydrolase 115 family protein [Arachnia sp.]
MTYLSYEPGGGVGVAIPGTRTRVAVDPSESPAVLRAVDNLIRDLGRVCPAAHVELTDDADGATVVIGTVESPPVRSSVEAGELDLSPLHDEHGRPRWEAFLIQVVEDTVYIVGADRRGTVFGVYDFCEGIGVSPWSWWGDVPVRRRDRVAVASDLCRVDFPSVKYRGIFINDEEELDNWARVHTGDDTIGPETYERIFELVLRLKGNYVWPAMHVNAFNQDPENGRLADEMGIVIGSSHCDMLLRSNEHEFAPWNAAQKKPVAYDYSLPGRNRRRIRDYWRGSVRQNGAFEVSWSVGMRGIHDTGFVTSGIGDEVLSEEEQHQAKVDLLGRVIRDQRALLVDELGDRGRDCLQLFIPYKEVLPLYDGGLDLPEDITIVWANDNFGYMRRYPAGAELERSGGHGLYYHSSYWSMPPRSYLATSSTPLALMQYELRRSWERGIRTLWVDNVGGLKPLELETEYFLRLAWQAGKETTTSSVVGFVEQWVDATFSGGHGRACGELYARYYQLNNQRKLEHLDTAVFSQTGYGDEAFRRVAALRELYDRVNEILAVLPEDERDAFFQLFAVKIHLAYLVSAQFAYADRSTLAYRQGRSAAADAYLETSRAFDAHKRALLHAYNHVISGGKWRLMLTPEQSPPPAMALFPAGTPALRIGEPGLGVAVWGDADGESRELTFWPYGVATKWIDIFSTGASGLDFTITADDWIELSETSGALGADRRISVSVPDPRAAAGRVGEVVVRAAGQEITVAVRVAEAPALSRRFVGTVEADGYVSLDVAHPDERRVTDESSWDTVPWLGRDGNALVEVRGGAGAVLGYRVHLATAGAHLLELHRLPTLDATGRIRVGVSVDGSEPVVVESPTTDEYRGVWTQAVLDNVERLEVRLPPLSAGEHTLRLHAIDDGVALSKLVIYTAERQSTNLGPRFSWRTSQPLVPVVDPDPGQAGLEALDDVAAEVYRTRPSEVPLPAVVYAGMDYWHGPAEGTARRAIVRSQRCLGAPCDVTAEDGGKDVVRRIPAGALRERGGVLAIEAERVLLADADAWTTPSSGPEPAAWTHTQAETDGRTGLAMHVAAPGRRWETPEHAPGLHYRVRIATPGRYHVWLLIKNNHLEDDSCWLAIDGAAQPLDEQHSGGELFGWDTSQLWHWTVLSDVTLAPGEHTVSLLAHEAGLRIDRVYLTTGDELPPADADWVPSEPEVRESRGESAA